jgi:lipopolysaccharide export system protein LptA
MSTLIARSYKALPVLVAGGVLAASMMGATAHGAGALAKHNSKAPVDYEADRIDLDDKNHHVVLTGNVVVTQDDLKIRARTVTIDYTNKGAMQIDRMSASGGVQMTRPNETAVGDVASYDLHQDIVVMAGHVALTRGNDLVRGTRLIVDLKSGQSNIVGASPMPGANGTPHQVGGRVSGSFTVPEKK